MKKICYILFLCGLTLTSCSDFLEEQSQSEVIPKTTADFSELLLGAGYPDHYGPNLSFLEYLDDDCSLYWTYTSWRGEADYYVGENNAVSYFNSYTWQPTQSDYDGFGSEINTEATGTVYYQFYNKIKGCNAVLDLIDDAIGTKDNRDRVKAEALAVRALLYFQLVNIYGEPYNYNKQAPGVPLKLDANLGQDAIPRSSVAEVYEKVILPDMLMAAKLMDPLPLLRKNYRINQPAIHILLSRIYLYMEQYDKCVEEANKAIAQGSRLFDLTKEFDFENTLPSQFGILSYNNPEVEWSFGASTRAENVNYKTANSAAFQALWDQDNDLRYQFFGLGEYTWGGSVHKPYGSGICQAVRSCEAWLNKMEAEALLGNDAAAAKDLNDFCKTRILNYSNTNATGDQLLKLIREERRRELCFEGHRWFDLRRQGMPEITHEYKYEKGGELYLFTLKHNDPMYTLPLPNSLFKLNTSLIQNDCRNSEERVGTVINN